MTVKELTDALGEIEKKLNEVSGWARHHQIEIEIDRDVNYVTTMAGRELQCVNYSITAKQIIK